MKVDLSKEDLITLVRGNSPSYSIMEKEPFKLCGDFNGSYGTWSWKNVELRKLSEKELFEMHITMKYQYHE